MEDLVAIRKAKQDHAYKLQEQVGAAEAQESADWDAFDVARRKYEHSASKVKILREQLIIALYNMVPGAKKETPDAPGRPACSYCGYESCESLEGGSCPFANTQNK